jgi:hypothetical protein
MTLTAMIEAKRLAALRDDHQRGYHRRPEAGCPLCAGRRTFRPKELTR